MNVCACLFMLVGVLMCGVALLSMIRSCLCLLCLVLFACGCLFLLGGVCLIAKNVSFVFFVCCLFLCVDRFVLLLGFLFIHVLFDCMIAVVRVHASVWGICLVL